MTENNAHDQHAATSAPTSATGDPGYGDPGFAERYGVRSGMSRARKITLGVFGFALLCGVAGYIAWNQANPQIQATVVSYTVNDSSITVTFEVDKAADKAVECTIQVQDVKGAVIGQANVSVPSGRAKEDMSYTVNTTGTPNAAQVASCTTTN